MNLNLTVGDVVRIDKEGRFSSVHVGTVVFIGPEQYKYQVQIENSKKILTVHGSRLHKILREGRMSLHKEKIFSSGTQATRAWLSYDGHKLICYRISNGVPVRSRTLFSIDFEQQSVYVTVSSRHSVLCLELAKCKYLCEVDRADFDYWKSLLCKVHPNDLPFWKLEKEIEENTLRQSNDMTKQWLHYSTLEPFLHEQQAMDALLKFLTEKLQKPQYLAFWFDVSQFEHNPRVKTALQIQEKYCVPNAFMFLQKVSIPSRYAVISDRKGMDQSGWFNELKANVKTLLQKVIFPLFQHDLYYKRFLVNVKLKTDRLIERFDLL